MVKKVKYLVVDTTPFIENANLFDIGEKILTVENVLNEIKNKRQLRHLAVLPYDIEIETVFPENVKFVNEAAKKIGEYRSLSITDIQIIALVYQLEKFHVGSDHLKSIDQMTRQQILMSNYETKLNSKEDDLQKSLNQLSINENICVKNNQNDENVDEETVENNVEDDSENDNDGTWITANNLQEVKRSFDGISISDENEDEITVACLTTDYAIQNVLKQIGLKIISLDGRVIKNLRAYVFRCHSCFKITSDMTKLFCPNCGNRTLKKVAVTIDDNGKQKVFINFKKPIPVRGKRFSIPRPRGGKHGFIPYLSEDTRFPQQRLSRSAMKKANPLNCDYIPGFSPFETRDINSRSALLGIRPTTYTKQRFKR